MEHLRKLGILRKVGTVTGKGCPLGRPWGWVRCQSLRGWERLGKGGRLLRLWGGSRRSIAVCPVSAVH
jgi:hypothetical protein